MVVLLLTYAVSPAQVNCPSFPDDCSTACPLGSLPAPSPCFGSSGVNMGAQATFNNLTNIGATPGNPYSALYGCSGIAGNNMAAPASDVWFSFTATASQLLVWVNGTGSTPLANPNVGLYQGSGCGSLTPVGCGVAGVGQQTNGSWLFEPLTAGQTYYLQISGNTLADQGDFTLMLQNNQPCDLCVLAANLTVNPAPTNGTYPANTTVDFCYTLSNWNQTSSNWFHGLEINIGSGWDQTTLTPTTTPPPCGTVGGGNWGWWTSVTGGFTGNTYGPGFFFDATSSFSGSYGNPGNNYGDDGVSGTGCPITFCWQITTPSAQNCVQGADLSVFVNSLGDYESGSWSSAACTNDPEFSAIAVLQCCSNPTVQAVDAFCGGANGTAIATGTGTGPFDYSWQDAMGNVIVTNTGINGPDTLQNILPGTYVVYVTDAQGCSTFASIIVGDTPGLGTTIDSLSNVSCNGAMDGMASVSATGGTGVYNYSWATNPPQLTQLATGLAAGNYTVFMDDVNNPACSTSFVVTITEPAALLASSNSGTNVTCWGGNDGTITVTPTGGSGFYSYSWNTNPPQDSQTAINLAAGLVTVTMYDSLALNCSTSATFVVSQPPAWNINTSISSQVSCNGGNDGAATVSATGGTGGLTYSWDTQPPILQGSASSLTAGTYTVYITDGAGCTNSTQVIITEPPALTATTNISQHVSCNGGNDGSALVSPAGGTGTYNYSWTSNPPQSTSVATGLTAGSYTVYVIDAGAPGCSTTQTVVITEPPALGATGNVVTNVSCPGANDGIAAVVASGGSGTFTYSWDTNPPQMVDTAVGLAPGSYTVYVFDANAPGCSITSNVIITAPPGLSGSGTVVADVSCNGSNDGIAYATASGGSGIFTYSWNTNPPQLTDTATNLPAGNYMVYIQDQTFPCSTVVNIVINQPGVLALIPGQTDVTCNGLNDGTAMVTPSGGSGAYSYSWDLNPPQTTQSVTGLPAGTYTVYVADANAPNCSTSTVFTITEPTVLTTSVNLVSDVDCNGGNNGSLTAIPVGGTGPYTYVWNTNPLQGTDTAVSLTAGTFSVTVIDQNGCQVTDSAAVSEPPAILLTTSGTNETCTNTNGTASVLASGGTGGYTYSWNSFPAQMTDVATGLPAGNYDVFVTDANGCVETATVSIVDEPAPVLSGTATDVSCNGMSDGSATVSALGGTGNYSYTWNTNPPQTTATATGLGAGTYMVTVDDGQCTVDLTLSIAEPSVLTSTLSTTNPSCSGDTDGNASVVPAGGTGPYTYSWSTSPPQFAAMATGLAGGVTYTVFVTDASGCQTSSAFSLNDPSPLSITSSFQDAKCHGGASGRASVFVTGGTSPYTYNWTGTTQTNNVVTQLTAGNYSVLVTDASGCTISESFTISQPPVFAISTNHTDLTCYKSNDGTASVSISGATPPYTVEWNTNPPQTTTTATGLRALTYRVTVRDANGCIEQTEVSLDQPPRVEMELVDSQDAFCDLPNGSLTVSASGGNGGFSYMWNTTPVQNTASAVNIDAGTYTVIASDVRGCSDTLTVSIDNIPPAVTAFTATPDNLEPLLVSQAQIQFINQSTGGVDYIWDFGDGSQVSVEDNPVHAYTEPGTYTVVLTGNNSAFICPTYDSLTFTVIPDGNLYIPNAFSPNGDGHNDFFVIRGDGLLSLDFSVYNRWGIEIISFSNLDGSWDGTGPDGTPVPEGVYVYKLNARLNGDVPLERSGTITVLR